MAGSSRPASVGINNRLKRWLRFSPERVGTGCAVFPFSRCHRSRRPVVTFNRNALWEQDVEVFPPQRATLCGCSREGIPHSRNALCVRRRQENGRGFLVGWCLLATDVRVGESRGRDDLYFPVRDGAETVAPVFRYFPVRGGAG